MKKELTLVIKTPASIANLGAGYDCLAMALDLWNYYEMKINISEELHGGKEYDIKINQGHNLYSEPRMSSKENNLFVNTFEHVREELCHKLGIKVRKHKIEITQNNYIPHIRGLGSSSSACVAGVLAAEEFIQNVYEREIPFLTDDIRASLARDKDSCQDNVCASLTGGMTFVYKDDEDSKNEYSDLLEESKLNIFKHTLDDEDLRVIVLVPNKELATLKAKEKLRGQRYDIHDVVFNLTRAVCLPEIFKNRKYELLNEAMKDKIHQDARSDFYISDDLKHKINLHRIFEDLVEKGAYGACIGGAGSSLVAFSSAKDASFIANSFESIFTKHASGAGWEIDSLRILKVINEGASYTKSFTYQS